MGNINNINLLTKISLKIVIFLMGFWSFLGYVDAATISSTYLGGDWYSEEAWIGGIPPGSNDIVIINGNVTNAIDINFNKLIINSGKSLTGTNYIGLTINGDIEIKNGGIFTYNNLKLNGNIKNNGEFNGDYSFINGTIENNGKFNGNIEIRENGFLELNGTKKYNSTIQIFYNASIKGNNFNLTNLDVFNGVDLYILGQLKIIVNNISLNGNIINGENLILEVSNYIYLDNTGIISKVILKNNFNGEVNIYGLKGNINEIIIMSNSFFSDYYNTNNVIGNLKIYGGKIFTSYGIINLTGKLINNGTFNGFINIDGTIENNGEFNGNIEIRENGTLDIGGKNNFNGNLNINYDSKLNARDLNINNLLIMDNVDLEIINDSIINIYEYIVIESSNIINGEKLKINSLYGNIYLNFTGTIGEFNIDNIYNTISYLNGLNGNINLFKINSEVLYSGYYIGNYNLNGNLYITENGNINGTINTFINGNLKNNGSMNGFFYINGGIENNGYMSSIGTFVNNNYNSLNIEAPGENEIITYENNYMFYPHVISDENQNITFVGDNSGYIDIYDDKNNLIQSNCINTIGCVNISEGIFNLEKFVFQYEIQDSYSCNINDNTSQNISSGHLVFDISNLKVKIDAAEKLAKQSEDTSKGDPVILNTGEFDYENTLMSYAGVNLPFEFKIKYKNQSYYNGPIGNNFDYNYNIYLTQDESGNINIHDGKLGVFKFTSSGSTFERNETIKANLELINNKYEISFDDKTKYVFGDNFKIEKIIDTYGNNLSFEYNNDRQLVKITDTLNREYNLSYYGHSRLYKIIDFAGNEVEFIYFNENETNGSQFDLKTIKMINGNSEKEISFTYTIGSDFESSHNIVKLIDSANNTYVENTYDSSDRVSSQTYGNGTIYYNYTVDTNNKITKNSVTDREGNVIDYYYDNFGNTTQKVIKKTNGDLEYNYEYDLNNNLIKETKPLGNGVLYNYDVNNNIIEKRLVQDTTSSGSINDIVINYTYDLNTNKPTQIVEPNGLITNLVYDTNNNLVSKEVIGVKDYNGTDISINESFTYNGSGQLVSQTNALGLETSFEYNSGNLTKIYNPHPNPLLIGEGITTEFSYDSKGNITSITDGEGNITNLSYDDFNLLISKTTSEGIVNEIIYNSLNKKTSEKIVLGTNEELNISYNYDILDNLTQSISEIDSGVNLITNYTYDTNSRIIETSTGSGAVESYIYDENGLILSKTVSYENNDVTTNYTYDLNERLIKQINPNNSEINFEYDLFDRIIKKIDINGSYTIYTYDKSNNITKQEIYSSNDVLIGKQEFVYDKQNRVIETKNHKLPNDIIISKTKYDSLGNTIKTIDGKGNETNYSYDIFSRLIQVEDSLGNKVQNSYDKNDNLIEKKIISSTNKTITTNYTYDSDNRLVSETNSLNKTKTYTYNKLNQVTSITDEEGNITNYTYTYTGKVKTSILRQGYEGQEVTTSYTYDQMGNMTSVTDSEGNITNYQYDQLNRLVKQIYADNKQVNYEYDTNNNLVQKIDPNGTIINYTYDSQNRLISKNITNGNEVVGITSETYSYDTLGRMIEANDSNNHKLEFNYDSLGRLITETQSGSLVSYGYDNNNNITSINDVNYTYDDLNRITNIGYNSNNIATYNYTGLENTSISYANNTSIIKGYDNLGRINSFNNGVNTYNYTYDDVNNITSDSIKNYLYDDIYRLKEVQNNINQEILESFNYDNVGNRINSFNINTGSGASFDYETNILNQYTSLSGSISSYELQEIIEEIQTGSGTTETITTYTGSIVTTNENTSFVYDNNGNLKNNGTFEFSYDYKNRLTKVETSSGIIVQYSYDVLNRRSILRQGYEGQVKETKYIYSNENILSEITTDETTNITTTKNYINGIGLDDLVAYEENNDIYYYHKNHLGSVEGISDNSGNIVVSYEYDSFGNFEITSGTDNGNTRLYTGREFDSEIGLYYLRARYYDSKLGRFISRDPIDIADDVNLYAYVGNNSLNYVDLMGMEGKLLVDIENGNKFVVELASRNLNSEYVGWVGIHSFIVIHSYGENGKNTYTIGGHNNEVTGMLDGEFNSSKDFISSNGYFGKGAFKGSIFLETPEGMSDAQFVRNIYDEYKDYNKDKKNYDKFGNEDGFKNVGNCNNFSTTLLYNASSNDSGIVSSISSFNPAGYNPGIGKQFHGSYYKSERKQINSCSE